MRFFGVDEVFLNMGDRVKTLWLMGFIEVGIEVKNEDLGVKTSDMPFLASGGLPGNVNIPPLNIL